MMTINRCVLYLYLLMSSGFLFSTQIVNEWNDAACSTASEIQYKWASETFKKLNLNGSEKVLDIGCGDGRISSYFARNLPDGEVVGIDSSSSMLGAAQSTQLKAAIPNLRFIKKNAMELDFDNNFDYVVSFNCLHWIPNHLATLQGIERSLKPGGKFFLYFAPDHGRKHFDQSMEIVKALPEWKDYFIGTSNHLHLISPATLTTQIEQAKLLIKRIEVITMDEIFESKESFMCWVSGWVQELHLLPSEKHGPFLSQITELYYKKHPLDSEGKPHFIDYWLEVEGEKQS